MPTGPIDQEVQPRPKPNYVIRRSARYIAAEIVQMIRSDAVEMVFTVPEMNEWIDEWCTRNSRELGKLTYGQVRAAIKLERNVRFENRRLIADPAYEHLRNRAESKRGAPPDRAWVFIIETVPDLPAASRSQSEHQMDLGMEQPVGRSMRAA